MELIKQLIAGLCQLEYLLPLVEVDPSLLCLLDFGGKLLRELGVLGYSIELGELSELLELCFVLAELRLEKLFLVLECFDEILLPLNQGSLGVPEDPLDFQGRYFQQPKSVHLVGWEFVPVLLHQKHVFVGHLNFGLLSVQIIIAVFYIALQLNKLCLCFGDVFE